MKQIYKVQESEELMRLDRFLRKTLSMPQSAIEKMIRKKKVLLNKKKTSASEIIYANQEIILFQKIETKAVSTNKGKKNHSKNIINDLLKTIEFENEEIVILNKPENLSSQCGTKSNISVDSILKDFNPDYRLTHRLDKDTSGLMIIAKNRQSAKKISELFKMKKIKKKYLAIICGSIKNTTGTITEPIFQNGKTKPSETRYKVIKKMNNYELLEVEILTGRKHQIRIHMANQSCPILGDRKHGNNKSKNLKLYLHAYSIDIDGIIKKTTPIPNYFAEKIQSLVKESSNNCKNFQNL